MEILRARWTPTPRSSSCGGRGLGRSAVDEIPMWVPMWVLRWVLP